MPDTERNERRVLVTGSRYWSDYSTIERAILWSGATLIIQGEARGADAIAKQVALKYEIPTLDVPAEWKKHGKAAGPLRNRKMLAEGKPDLVLAFPIRGSKGTVNMIRQAREAAIPVEVYDG